MCECVREVLRFSEVIVGLTVKEQHVMGKALRMYDALWASPEEKGTLKLLLECEVWCEDQETMRFDDFEDD